MLADVEEHADAAVGEHADVEQDRSDARHVEA